MHAEIRTVRDPETRVQIVEERSNFDSDPDAALKANAAQLRSFKGKNYRCTKTST